MQEPAVGIVYNPFLEEMYKGWRGGGSYLNGKRLHVAQAKVTENDVMDDLEYKAKTGHVPAPRTHPEATLIHFQHITYRSENPFFILCISSRRLASVWWPPLWARHATVPT